MLTCNTEKVPTTPSCPSHHNMGAPSLSREILPLKKYSPESFYLLFGLVMLHCLSIKYLSEVLPPSHCVDGHAANAGKRCRHEHRPEEQVRTVAGLRACNCDRRAFTARA